MVEVSYLLAVNDPGIVHVFPELEAARAAANDCGTTGLAAELEPACVPAVEDPDALETFEIDGGIAGPEEPSPQPTSTTPANPTRAARQGNCPLRPPTAGCLPLARCRKREREREREREMT